MMIGTETSRRPSSGNRSFSTISARLRSTGCRFRLANAVTRISHLAYAPEIAAAAQPLPAWTELVGGASPINDDPGMETRPLLDFKAGYVMRAALALAAICLIAEFSLSPFDFGLKRAGSSKNGEWPMPW